MIDLTRRFHSLAKSLTDHIPSCASLLLRNSSSEGYSLFRIQEIFLPLSLPVLLLFFFAISSSPFLRFSLATFAYVGSLGNQFPAVSVQFHRADIPIHYAAHAAHTRFSFARERARCIHLAARGAPNDRRTRTGHSERYRWQDIVNLQESHGFYLMRSNAQFPDGLLTFPTVFLSRTCVTLRHLLV